MRSRGTMLSTKVHADRHGPSMITRSPAWRTSANSTRYLPICPPLLAWITTAAGAGATVESHSSAASRTRRIERNLVRGVLTFDIPIYASAFGQEKRNLKTRARQETGYMGPGSRLPREG